MLKANPEPTNEFTVAVQENADRWVPANGGAETVFLSRSGVRMLYCYNPKLGKHAYLNVDSDIIIPDDEIGNYLLTF